MTTYYDDNFGFYDIRDQDDIDFYHENQKRTVEKECSGCGQTVMLLPQYGYCNSCATKRERGYDI